MENIPNEFYRVSVKALILNESRDKFALSLEANDYWELPGGGLYFEEKYDECLRREVKQETGLDIIWIDSNPSYFWAGPHTSGYYAVNIIFEVTVKDLNITTSDECKEIRFVSPEEVENMLTYANVKELARVFDKTRHQK